MIEDLFDEMQPEEIKYNAKCKQNSFKSLFLYGFFLSTMILYIGNLYFEKINENEITKTQFTINTSKLTIINRTTCDPYKSNLNIFNVMIDNEIYPKVIPLYNNPKINYSCLNTDKSSKVILLWNTWFGDSTFDYGIGNREPFEKNRCPVTNCEITNDRSRIMESSLIIFHMRDAINQFPEFRKSQQRWVFYLYESPVHSPNFNDYNSLFNLSATYKLDSNFTSFYFTNYIWAKNENFDENKDFSENKTEFAAIVVSNCNSKSGRLSYVKELQKSIPVNIFGTCGKPCPKFNDDGSEGDCKEIISKKYKFYLAFENSFCKDYVTEKFFNILRHDIIPVVYGDGSYSTYVPKSGYINAFDFATAKHLAEYLMFLDNNKTAYNSYFKWKKYIKFIDNGPRNGQICELCLRLNLDIYEGIENHVITDMNKFWSAGSDCENFDENNF